MRLWSIHPSYLDTIGLVALWREGLLARKALSGNTVGYRNHPQLNRFKAQTQPVETIDGYLTYVYEEAVQRGFRFNPSKIRIFHPILPIVLTTGQLDYEFHHLLNKLKHRDPVRWYKLKDVSVIRPHPLFYIREGPVCDWEIIHRTPLPHIP